MKFLETKLEWHTPEDTPEEGRVILVIIYDEELKSRYLFVDVYFGFNLCKGDEVIAWADVTELTTIVSYFSQHN